MDVGPFLRDHQLVGRVFWFGAGVAPVSIRDQLVRAQLFVRGCVDRGLVSPKDKARPLVVIGAGVTGVEIAAQAGAQGVHTVLINEGGQLPFTRQRDCHRRQVCPTEYDWPAHHFANQCFPHDRNGPGILQPSCLPYDFSTGHALAVTWDASYQGLQSGHPYAAVDDGLIQQISPTGANGYPVVRTASAGGAVTTYTASALVIAVSHGREKVYLDSAHDTYGYEFWHKDAVPPPPAHQLYGFVYTRPPERNRVVLISGSGDGALRDYIDLMIHPRFRGQGLAAVTTFLRLPSGFLDEVGRVQAACDRHFLYTPDKTRNHNYLLEYHNEIVRVVGDLLSSATFRSRLRQAIHPDPPEVHLAHPCDHFTDSYPLNRVLALLIAGYADRYMAQPTIVPNCKLASVVPVGHLCGQNPANCRGHQHEVTFARARCQGQQRPSGSPPQTVKHVDLLIMRHGTEPPAVPPKNRYLAQLLRRPPIVRQTLPCGLFR